MLSNVIGNRVSPVEVVELAALAANEQIKSWEGSLSDLLDDDEVAIEAYYENVGQVDNEEIALQLWIDTWRDVVSRAIDNFDPLYLCECEHGWFISREPDDYVVMHRRYGETEEEFRERAAKWARERGAREGFVIH